MLYGYSCHPLPRHSDTVFGGASYFTSQKGTVVYSPEAVAFYNGAQDSKVDGLKFLAAMGVCVTTSCSYGTLITVKILYL